MQRMPALECHLWCLRTVFRLCEMYSTDGTFDNQQQAPDIEADRGTHPSETRLVSLGCKILYLEVAVL